MTSGLSHTFGATLGPVVEMTTGLTSSVFTSDLGAFAFLVVGFFLVVVFLVVFFFCAMRNTLVKRCPIVGEPG